MNKLKLSMAVLITAIALSSCGDAATDAIVAAVGTTPIKPDGKTETNIVVTFKNGWEDVATADLEDDDYTSFKFYSGLTPATVNAVVDTAEQNAYDAAYAVWEAINDAWVQYGNERDEAANNDKDPPPPPNDPLPPEPVPPIATIPFFPGDEYLATGDVLAIAGSAPEWDFHTLTGWKIEDGEEATLNTPITENTTVTAVWDPAPKKPYYTVTFNKNDGTGAFEKRIATPEKVWYELNAAAKTEEAQPEEAPQPEESGETMSIQFTTDAESPDRKQDGLIFGENYRLRDSIDSDLIQAAAPEFTRAHYKSDGWKDMTGNSVTPTYKDGGNTNANSYNVTGDTQLYQQWTANTFTVTFNLNGKTPSAPASPPADIIGVNEALSATGGLKAAGKAESGKLPWVGANIIGTADETNYEFVNWTDTVDGAGNDIGASTPLFPKDETAKVILYAQWRVEGIAQYNFSYSNGTVQTWTANTAGVYKIEVWGAGGDGSSGDNGKGGHGGYIGGDIELTKGQILYIYAGGQGKPNNGSSSSVQAGGWNGGGNAPGAIYSNRSAGGGGHGATDVRTEGGAWDDMNSLNSRIIVAGGGGGAAGGGGSYNGSSGNGGYGKVAGGDGLNNKANATATAYGGGLDAGGQPSNSNIGASGGFGKGGNGGRSYRGGGGGGAGYYGGSGGTTVNGDNYPGGGGGGSSWAQEEGDGLKFTNIVPQEAVGGGGTNNGHGRVKITLVSVVEEE
jgi:hypothetical protein